MRTGRLIWLQAENNDIAIVVIPENAEATDTRVYLLRIKRAGASATPESADMTGLDTDGS